MKNTILYIFILASLVITSCAGGDVVDLINNEDNSPVNTQDSIKTQITDGVSISLPDLIDGNAANESTVASRSALVYDRTAKKMVFSWGEEDSEAYTCIFALNKNVSENPDDAVTPQVYTRRAGQDATAMNCTFEGPDGVRALTPTDGDGKAFNYISFRPYSITNVNNSYTAPELNYKKLDISYEGQTQTANAKMKLYYTNSDNYAAYDESEKKASSHLGAYDYLVSEPQTTDDEGGIAFQLKRVGVVVRFNIKNPSQEIFEELQLVTKGAPLFTLQGTINLEDQSITPAKTSNVMVLKYGNGGIDMTDTNSDYYDYYNSKYYGYIISYMILAPINLYGDGIEIHLYLVSHTKDNTTKKYYKSSELSKPNLTSNMFYKWSPANAANPDDTPITFSEITVQQWQYETSVDNGTDGTGTIGW